MAKRSRITDDSAQMELIPECSDASKKKLKRLLATMETKADECKALRAEHDAAQTAVIEYIRDVEKVMPDKDGNYRLRLDADESICIGHGKSKVTVKRTQNADAGDEGSPDDQGDEE